MELGIDLINMENFIFSFIKAKKRRKFPKFWQSEWLLDMKQFDEFTKVANPPYIFIECIEREVLQVWGRKKELKVKKEKHGVVKR
jgi:hypothetical protein